MILLRYAGESFKNPTELRFLMLKNTPWYLWHSKYIDSENDCGIIIEKSWCSGVDGNGLGVTLQFQTSQTLQVLLGCNFDTRLPKGVCQ